MNKSSIIEWLLKIYRNKIWSNVESWFFTLLTIVHLRTVRQLFFLGRTIMLLIHNTFFPEIARLTIGLYLPNIKNPSTPCATTRAKTLPGWPNPGPPATRARPPAARGPIRGPSGIYKALTYFITYWKRNFPMTQSVPSDGWLVGRSVRLSVCHRFLKGREVSLPCTYLSTFWLIVTFINIMISIIIIIMLFYFYPMFNSCCWYPICRNSHHNCPELCYPSQPHLWMKVCGH